MNESEIFEFKGNDVRTVLIKGEPHFVGKDVADILGYSETNAMTKRLDEEDFISAKLSGMNMKSTIINESGLYAAIIGSKLPAARNRIELLKGLVDTDGTLATKKNQKNYHIMYSTTSNKLAKDVEELVTELGYGVNTTYRKIDKENHNDFWEVRIYTPDIIWSSKKNFKKIVGKEYCSNQHLCSAIKNIEKI